MQSQHNEVKKRKNSEFSFSFSIVLRSSFLSFFANLCFNQEVIYGTVATLIYRVEMASKVKSGGSKGSRNKNKRKLRPNPSSGEPNKIVPSLQHESTDYEFSTEKLEMSPGQVQAAAPNLLNVSQGNSGRSKLVLALTNAVDALKIMLNRRKEEHEADECQNADWSDLTEAKLEEHVLSDLDIRFKRLIKKIAALSSCTEEAATKAMLRFSNCCGRSDTFSNIFDNTLAFLRNGQEIDPSKEHYFEDLVQLEKYVMTELVCILQEVRPSLSTGDALWWLLICDLNLLQACSMITEPLSSLRCDGTAGGCSFVQTESQSKLEAKGHKLNLPSPCKSVPSGNHGAHNLKNSQILGGLSEKEGDSGCGSVDKSLCAAATSQSHRMEEMCGCLRKVNSSCTKRDYTLQQKSFHVEKSYLTYGSKGSSRVGKVSSLSGLILDKKLKYVMETTTINLKSASSLNISNTVRLDRTEDKSSTRPIWCNNEAPNSDCVWLPYSKSLAQWIPQESKDDLILKLVPKVQELQNRVNKWTEFGNQKVMQAALQLIQDKAELKTLRQEKDEIEHRIKEKQYLEGNTLKRLSEMENALDSARAKLKLADATVRILEGHNATFRREMEAAKLRAAESTTSFQDVSKREKDTKMKIQSQEKEKSIFQEVLVTEKHKFAQLQKELKEAQEQKEQAEVRWLQAAKAKEEVLRQLSSIRKEREKIEESTKYREERMKLKAENTLQRYEADIKKYEEEIEELKRKQNYSKIAALRRGIGEEESCNTFVAELVTDMNDFSVSGRVKRERECVMCLYKEISVVFLPCAHQVVCASCNELLEKQGMPDCPSCRTPIQKRISVRYARRGTSFLFG